MRCWVQAWRGPGSWRGRESAVGFCPSLRGPLGGEPPWVGRAGCQQLPGWGLSLSLVSCSPASDMRVVTAGDKSLASPKYDFKNSALSQLLFISGWGQIVARKRQSLRARGTLFLLTFPSWPDSRRLQKIPPAHCHPGSGKVSAVDVPCQQEGPRVGAWGQRGSLRWVLAGWPLPGAHCPRFGAVAVHVTLGCRGWGLGPLQCNQAPMQPGRDLCIWETGHTQRGWRLVPLPLASPLLPGGPPPPWTRLLLSCPVSLPLIVALLTVPRLEGLQKLWGAAW